MNHDWGLGPAPVLVLEMADKKIILAVNAGSSSLKTALFVVENKQLNAIAHASVSGFTSPPAKEKYSCRQTRRGGDLNKVESHSDAFEHILGAFIRDQQLPEVKGKDDIDYVCHRVVHGGDYSHDQVIDQQAYHTIESLEDLAPL